LVAGAQPRVFTHQDYHPGNILFAGDTLVGVVDWMHAANEPAESSVAFCRKDLAVHPGGDAPDRFLAAYEAETGRRLDIGLWDVLHGARALQWGHLWVPSFAEAGVSLTSEQIVAASAAFVDTALSRRR
jgi:aminoglycoside phosphotransferase (APT) family kinase protein